jgi:hypothetical protein
MGLKAVAIVGPILAWLLGIGFVRRDRPAFGWTLVACGVAASAVLAALGDLRPAVGLVAIAGLSEGIVLDQRGHRPVGLLSFSAGFLGLLIAVFYT